MWACGVCGQLITTAIRPPPTRAAIGMVRASHVLCVAREQGKQESAANGCHAGQWLAAQHYR